MTRVTPWDQTWIDALTELYPVEGAVLPYWNNALGFVDAKKTITNFLRLIGVEIGTDGKVADPYEHSADDGFGL